MPPAAPHKPLVFFVETHFQKMAQRPGGISREQAIEIAQTTLEKLKPDFHNWLDEKLLQLNQAVEGAQSSTADSSAWIEVANQHSRGLRDVGATLGFELISFIANSLCEMLQAENLNVAERIEAIRCHVQALMLARQERYQSLRPADVPELTNGLRQVAAAAPVRQ